MKACSSVTKNMWRCGNQFRSSYGAFLSKINRLQMRRLAADQALDMAILKEIAEEKC
jgi:hypothetical protein